MITYTTNNLTHHVILQHSLRGYSVAQLILNLRLFGNLELRRPRPQHGAIFVPADICQGVASQSQLVTHSYLLCMIGLITCNTQQLTSGKWFTTYGSTPKTGCSNFVTKTQNSNKTLITMVTQQHLLQIFYLGPK
jgi:hypothetical protein